MRSTHSTTTIPAHGRPGGLTERGGTRSGGKSPKRKQSRNNAGKEAGERAIGRAQTLTESIATIAVRAQQPMDTVRRVLQATQRVAAGHLSKSGSGKFNVPYVGVQLYRTQQSARPARTLPLFGTGRTIELRRSPARLVARAKVLQAMRDAPLR